MNKDKVDILSDENFDLLIFSNVTKYFYLYTKTN